MKTLQILVSVVIAAASYLLLLALVPELGETMPGWQRLVIVVAAVTAFVGALRALALAFGPVKR